MFRVWLFTYEGKLTLRIVCKTLERANYIAECYSDAYAVAVEDLALIRGWN